MFLKQLEGGLLLVTGPYKVNGVPLRRVPQSYVIATKTKVDISGVNLPERLNDDYFKREKKEKKRSEEMFEEAAEVGGGQGWPDLGKYSPYLLPWGRVITPQCSLKAFVSLTGAYCER